MLETGVSCHAEDGLGAAHRMGDHRLRRETPVIALESFLDSLRPNLRKFGDQRWYSVLKRPLLRQRAFFMFVNCLKEFII